MDTFTESIIPTATFKELEQARDTCAELLRGTLTAEERVQLEGERKLYIAEICKRLCGECTGAGIMAGNVPCKQCQAKGFIEPSTVNYSFTS